MIKGYNLLGQFQPISFYTKVMQIKPLTVMPLSHTFLQEENALLHHCLAITFSESPELARNLQRHFFLSCLEQFNLMTKISNLWTSTNFNFFIFPMLCAADTATCIDMLISINQVSDPIKHFFGVIFKP